MSLLRPAVWLLLFLSGSAASLSLTNAGRALAYQHLVPWSELLHRPLPVGLLLVQTLLVMAAARAQASNWTQWVCRRLPGWRLPLLLLANVAVNAVVGRDLRRFGGELVLATLLQLLQLATVALCVTALPAAAVARVQRIIRTHLTDHAPEPPDHALLDRFAWGVASAVVLMTALLAVFAYEGHPHVPDEVAYVFQANIFASGRVALAPPPVPAAFETFLVSIDSHGWYSPMQPGIAAILAPFARVGVIWLANPLISGLNVLLVYALLRPLVGRGTTRLIVLLFAVSPWQLFLGMSFMAHTATLCCGLLALLAVAHTRRTGRWAWCLLGGLALALAASIRQLDALIFALAAGLWAIGWGGPRIPFIGTLSLVAASMLGTFPMLWFNRYFTGHVREVPVMSYFDRQFGVGANSYGFGANRGMGWALDPNPGHGPVDGLINSALNAAATQVELFGWSIGSLLLVLLVLVRGRFESLDRQMLVVIVGTWLLYFFFYYSGGPDFGARYWYPMIVPLIVLSVRGLEQLLQEPTSAGSLASTRGGPFETEAGARAIAGVAVCCLGAVLLFVPWRAADKYLGFRGMRPTIADVVRAAGARRDLVLVRGKPHPDYASAFALNPLSLAAPQPVFAHRTSPENDAAVVRAFPDRRVFFVDGPSETGGVYRVTRGPLSADAALVLVTQP